MKHYELDPKALLGGVIALDGNQEIVQLSLQKNNEIPAYETDAIILLLVLNGKAEIKTVDQVLQTKILVLSANARMLCASIGSRRITCKPSVCKT